MNLTAPSKGGTPAAADADPDNLFGYPPQVWRLFRTAPGAGRWPADTPGLRRGEATTPAGRHQLCLYLRCTDAQVLEARFLAYGCPVTIAVGAWLSQNLPGHTFDELRGWSASTIRSALEIPEDKAHCAFLGEDALQSALAAP